MAVERCSVISDTPTAANYTPGLIRGCATDTNFHAAYLLCQWLRQRWMRTRALLSSRALSLGSSLELLSLALSQPEGRAGPRGRTVEIGRKLHDV